MKTKTKSLNSLIKACDLNYINENIVKLFETEPVRGKIEVTTFGRPMTSEQVIEELKKDGCVPANATELYTWISENKDWGKEAYRNVVALGSVASFEGGQRVPLAWWDDSEHGAYLYWFDSEFHAYDWFAFSRESSPKSLETILLEKKPLALPNWKYTRDKVGEYIQLNQLSMEATEKNPIITIELREGLSLDMHEDKVVGVEITK